MDTPVFLQASAASTASYVAEICSSCKNCLNLNLEEGLENSIKHLLGLDDELVKFVLS